MAQPQSTSRIAVRGESVGMAPSSIQQSRALDGLEAKIADPATPIQEVVILTRVRGEIIRQDEFRSDRQDARRAKSRQFFCKLAFSAAAVITGGVLIVVGHALEGFVIMGVGFHWLAPDFVKNMYDRLLGGRGKGDAE